MKLELAVRVPGEPRGQGSLRLITTPSGKEQASYSSPVVNHRNLVVGIFRDEWGDRPPLTGPLAVRGAFIFPRPASHYLPANRKRAERELRPDAPYWHENARDVDKLMRLVLDAGTIAGLYRDDGQVAIIRGEKVYGEEAGSELQVWSL